MIILEFLMFGIGCGFGLFFAIGMVIALTDKPKKNRYMYQKGYNAALRDAVDHGRIYFDLEDEFLEVQVNGKVKKETNNEKETV